MKNLYGIMLKLGGLRRWLWTVLGLSSVLTACSSDPPPVDMAMQQLLADLAPLKEAQSQNPQDPNILLEIAQIYEKHNQVDSALVAYQRCIDAAPGNWLAHFKLGRLQYSSGRTLAALDAYRNALDARPNNAEAHNNIGFIYKKSGQLDSAEVAYRRAIDCDSTFVEAYNNLGQVYKQQEKWEEAIIMFQWAIELEPEFAGAYLNLATTCRKGNRPQEEKEILQAYLDRFGKSAPQSAIIAQRLSVLNSLPAP